jgi:hypothetical protein
MDESSHEQDVLEQLLTPSPTGTADDPVRREILRQTNRVVRRRRRVRQCGYVAALVACYLAGMGTMRLWQTAPSPDTVEGTVLQVPQPAPPESPVQLAALPLEEDTDAPAYILERAAPDSEKCALYYRLAGDRYLERDRDLQAALRCYTRFLETSTERDWGITAEDTWLLVSLKKARIKEKTHDNANG